ncbi:LPS assembly lipoprotein LptE [Flavobacteriales bacterium]|nr:LPS assembly lipoprotein LptE [Flavobacteriales bacterium]
MKLVYTFILSICISSCGIYSFTGASIPAKAKTISVQYFNNKSATVQPTLSQVFTERLKDIFLEQTNLTLIEQEGDLEFSGYISKYEIKPMAIKANETAGKNRLTISVKVIYKNSLDSENNFEQIFNRYYDYDSGENIADIESTLIEGITNELAEDVFNKAFVNW